MPIIVNLAAMLLFGAGLATIVKTSPAVKERFVNWAFLLLLSFIALIITPATTFALRFYPQWSMLYLFDPQLFPELDNWLNLFSLVSALSNFAVAIAGYSIARSGHLASRPAQWLIPFIIGCGILIGAILFRFNRILYVGDYDAFWQGQASLFITTLPGIFGSVSYLGAFIFLLWIHSRFGNQDPEFL